MADSRSGQEIHKRSLDHFVVPESKEMLKTKAHTDGDTAKRHKSQLKELPAAKARTAATKSRSSTRLDNLKCKINIHEPMLI